jgi:hypothetical protein
METATEIGIHSAYPTNTKLMHQNTSTELKSINFYDEACGDDYLGGESELFLPTIYARYARRPIAVCDSVHVVLDKRLRENEVARIQLPTVPEGTGAAKLLVGLSATTTKTEINAACALASDATKQLADLAQEEVRLQATDPDKERGRIEGLAAKVQAVADHVSTLAKGLSGSKIGAAEVAFSKAVELRAAAAVASSTTFENEPISGVGTETWRAL